MNPESDPVPIPRSAASNEPLPDRNWEKLNPCFAHLIEQLIVRARAAGLDVDIFEGHRTLERQQWLHGRGRTRAGSIVTSADGVHRQSWHQVGLAADIHFRSATGDWIEPNRVPVAKWERLAGIGRELGLICGNDWKSRDRVHFEASFFADLTPEQRDACRR